MTKNEMKQYLQQYRSCMAKAYRLGCDMQQFTASAASIKKEMDDCISRSSRIEELISSHEDLMEREILIRKYIYGDTIESIADILSYSPRHIQRILDKAAESLGRQIA